MMSDLSAAYHTVEAASPPEPGGVGDSFGGSDSGGVGGGGGIKSGTMKQREQKRRPKPRDGTVLFCGVCGDRALGYNFDAISCESCKAFFRRNALKTKPFTCSFDGNCKLDAHTRKFCSGCRMKKCFDVGMKKEWILSEDQLSKRRKRQQTRRPQPQNMADIQACTSSSCMDTLPDSCSSHTAHSPGFGGDYGSPNHPSNPLPYVPYGQGRFAFNEGSGRNVYSQRNNSYDHCTSPTPLSQDSYVSHRHHPHYEQPKQQQSHGYPAHISERKWSQCSQDSVDSTVSTTSQHSPPYGDSSLSPPLPPLPYPHSLHSLPRGSLGSVSSMEPAAKVMKVEPFTDLGGDTGTEATSSVASPNHLAVNYAVVKSEVLYEDERCTVPLSPYIKDKLSRLLEVYNEIFEAPYAPEHLSKLKGNPQSADELFNMTDIFIRRLIRFAKNLPEFKLLTQGDQIALLKGGIMEMFVLRSCMGFDSKSKGWKFKVQNDTGGEAEKPKDCKEGQLDSKALNTLGTSMFVNHMDFVQSLQELTLKDRTILMLLFIMELMSPDRAQLEDQAAVRKCQDRHSFWLKAYLESVRPLAEARLVYPKILWKLQDVRQLGEDSGHLAATLEVAKLAPLLVEVLDLRK